MISCRVRSTSQARHSKERSVSPRRRIREASVRSDQSDAASVTVTGRSDFSLSDTKTKADRAALRSTRATNTNKDEKNKSIRQKGARNDIGKTQATKMTQHASETEGKKTDSLELKTLTSESVTAKASESTQEESEKLEDVVNTIDESSESANTVIKKFENKITEVSGREKSSFCQSNKSYKVVARSTMRGSISFDRSSSYSATSSSMSATNGTIKSESVSNGSIKLESVSDGSLKSESVSNGSFQSETVSNGSRKSESVSKTGLRRAQSMKAESRDKFSSSASRARPGQGSGTTNNLHSNSNGLSRTGAAKKQHLDTNGKGSSTKMVMGKNRYIYTDYYTAQTSKLLQRGDDQNNSKSQASPWRDQEILCLLGGS